MPTVDSKGRIVLPQEVRERLDIDPGTEVTVREEAGRAIVEPEDDPQQILDRMETLVAETTPASEERHPFEGDSDPIARRHREAVQDGAERTDG
jgi:AbrB family looped-hinge helix DNA binding protein